ncbi:MAG: lipopolysaccharide kinase InaA family protein [Kiritimatiellales bacterium]
MREISTVELRRAGRAVPPEFSITTKTGEVIQFLQPFRILPKKRITGKATVNGETVLVKLFISKRGRIHCRRELRGLILLKNAGIPTPEIKGCIDLASGGKVLIIKFLEQSETLRKKIQISDKNGKVWFASEAARLTGKMHNAGIIHGDLHTGNFLSNGEHLWMIDGDAVKTTFLRKPAHNQKAIANLSSLLFLLSAAWSEAHQKVMESYLQENPSIRLSPEKVWHTAKILRRNLYEKHIKKSFRSSAGYSVQKTFFKFTSTRRDASGILQPVLKNPDEFIENGFRLKTGGSSTVAQFDCVGQQLVIKRYNLKNRRHAFLRFWRPSRAWNAWKAGQLLQLESLNTPAPVALIEERFWIFRRHAWIINEFCAGKTLQETLDPQQEPASELKAALLNLFDTLHTEKISHGDMKATNLIWNAEKLFLIDLDVMKWHRSGFMYKKKWAQDRVRFLQNWPPESSLYRWLDANLPE